MKNLKTISMKVKLILLCAILSIMSCSKDDEIQGENQQIQSVFDQMNILSESYYTNDGKADIDWKKVAIADVAAGLGEAADPNSTVLSVTLVAAAASVKEYNNQQSSASISNSGGSTSGQIDSNETNPYDSYGYWHYASIDNVLIDPERYLNGEEYANERFYETTKEFLWDNGVGNPADYESITLDLANEKLAFNSELFDHYGLSGGLLYLLERMMIEESVYQIMKPYYNVLENTNNTREFVEYSLQAEELVANSELTRKDKEIVLSTMATARYGLQYWSIKFNNN